jgi:YVTN family beta-propeller protein
MGGDRRIELRILGPLEAFVDGQPVPLGGAKQRAVLAILILHRGKPVSTDRLIDALWGERAPQAATKTVQVYVSRLRKVLGEGVVITRGGGYALENAAAEIDVERFEHLAEAGRAAIDRGDPPAAAEDLREALALWRGPPLADLTYESFAQPETGRLEELRVAALEDRIEADLAVGRHSALVPELETAVREHPERERLRGQLMLALYRSGRQAEALEAYRDARRALAEVGLEPGPELRQLEQAILEQDPTIAAAPRGATPELLRHRRGAGLVLAGGGLLLGAAVAAIVLSGSDGSDSASVEPNSLAVIDADTHELVGTVPTGVEPTDVSVGEGYVWVANQADDTVTQIDPATQEIVGTATPDVSGVAGLAAGRGALWIADSRGSNLVRLDPEFRSVVEEIRLAPEPAFDSADVNPVAIGSGDVWVGKAEGGIGRVDPQRDEIVDRVPAGNSTSAIATGLGGIWVADDADNTVARIDPAGANAVTATVPVGQGARGIAVGEGAVWVANTQDGTVMRLDPTTAAPTATIPVGGSPGGIAAGEGAVWVADGESGTLVRIDPESNEVETTIEIGESPGRVAVADGRVWVSVQGRAAAPESPAAAPDDVAIVLASEDPGTTDPVLHENFQIQFATCALLYNYPDRPYPEGTLLQPEVAAGEPVVTDGGTTFTFRVRSGFRFSPPSNEPVTAAAFERALERALSPDTGSFAAELLRDIVGANAYIDGRAERIAGVAAEGDRLMIELTKPVPDLLSRLAAPYFCATPPDTPIDPEGIDTIPTAGPYYVASHDRGQSFVLRRNPNYDGSRPQGLEEIRYEIGAPLEDAVAEVEAGRADYVIVDPILTGIAAGLSAEAQAELASRYGPDSDAARAGSQQLFIQPTVDTHTFAFNTGRQPFSDERLRQAVNYAIDRPALAEHTGVGGAGRPTDQYLPPGIPGFEDAVVYPLGGPDLAMARRLAGGEHHAAALYTCDAPGCTRHAGILRSNLEAIGIDLDVHQFPIGEMFSRIGRPAEPWDLAYTNWFVDFADPASYINLQFGPESPLLGHLPHDPAVLRQMEQAARATGDERLRAYARLDRDLTERAAFGAVYATGNRTHFLSARMGCEVLHPIYELDLAALCVEE